MTAAIVALAIALAGAVGSLVWHVAITRADAKEFRDLVKKLGTTERDLEAKTALVATRDAELVTRKQSEAAAVALAAQRAEQLKGVRRESLDRKRGDDLLDAVDRLSVDASGRPAADAGDGDGPAAGGVLIDSFAADGPEDQ